MPSTQNHHKLWSLVELNVCVTLQLYFISSCVFLLPIRVTY